jgi:DNA repair exonuclease SbcCD ATPase subunit
LKQEVTIIQVLAVVANRYFNRQILYLKDNYKQKECPVCGKPLTEQEFDKALGLWKDKQEHIKHLEAEQRKLKQQELENKKKFEVEKNKLQAKEQAYKKQLTDQAKHFKQQQTELKTSLERKMKTDITKGVEKA